MTPLEKIRAELALKVGENAVFDGWKQEAVDSAAAQLDIDRDKARLAFPKRPEAMVAAWIEAVDAEMARRQPPEKLADLRVTERIRTLIWTRLEIAGDAREAVRQGLSILSMPQNIGLGLSTAWHSADVMWRLAGDTATDFNHYSKRTILAGVYGATLLSWLDDDSEGWTETAAFLDRRLADVGKFEKLKAQWRKGQARRPSFVRFAGRLRYPPR
ncbi:COQ9 family protein [Sphingomicrobium clamense]|uniref:COQ9 family protein n=1 Tax=Sphingomicrobium clamense TaxID=2851013 RepID=A0ABS6V2Y7_9SPHN|nr:COQ9 family protein [Sphingomicrobium sp. B8]MBW0143886.1 COQ9 family protein [Sphingomicrobium sp. B8]